MQTSSVSPCRLVGRAGKFGVDWKLRGDTFGSTTEDGSGNVPVFRGRGRAGASCRRSVAARRCHRVLGEDRDLRDERGRNGVPPIGALAAFLVRPQVRGLEGPTKSAVLTRRDQAGLRPRNERRSQRRRCCTDQHAHRVRRRLERAAPAAYRIRPQPRVLARWRGSYLPTQYKRIPCSAV